MDMLRLEVQRKEQAVRNAEQKGAEFEDWGRETKTHYQELVRQMESDLRSPTKPAAPNLPTLQLAVPGMHSIYSDVVATPKKKSRASLPAPRTPLHLLLQNGSDFVAGSVSMSTRSKSLSADGFDPTPADLSGHIINIGST